MSWVAAAVIGGSLVTAYAGNQAAKKASSASNYATDQSIAEQKRQFDINQQNMQPFIEGGTNAFKQLQAGAGGGQYTPEAFNYSGAPPSFSYNGQVPTYTPNAGFSFDSSNLTNDPAYKFALSQALEATNRQNAGSGMYESGNRAIALQDRAAGLASQQYQNAFNNALQGYNVNTANNANNYATEAGNEATAYQRALTGFGINQGNEATQYGRALQQNQLDQSNQATQYNQYQSYLNRLAAMAGIGQTSATSLGNQGATTAGNIGNAYLQNGVNQGNAAATQWGSINNAVQGGTNNYLTYLQNQKLLSMIPSATGGGSNGFTMPIAPNVNPYGLNSTVPTY